MKIAAIGDIHFKESRGYADYISDRRIPEQQEILDFIFEQSKDCDKVVLLGDSLNGRNNPSRVLKEFVEFLERFKDKQLYILAGNHEKFGDGRSAIDFLKEIKGKHWTVITDTILDEDGITFCPYFTRPEVGAKDSKQAATKIQSKLKPNKILFVHHAISESKTTHGGKTDLFDEAVLNRKTLEKKFELIVGGHIHQPDYTGKTIVTGSVFCDEVGELGKNMWIIDSKKDKIDVTPVRLPGRGIFKVENPAKAAIDKIPPSSIVKAIVTKKGTDIEATRELLRKFDAYVLVEQYPRERKKVHFEEGMLEFTVEQLLGEYAKQKKLDVNVLKRAWAAINF